MFGFLKKPKLINKIYVVKIDRFRIKGELEHRRIYISERTIEEFVREKGLIKELVEYDKNKEIAKWQEVIDKLKED
jgi:hypothetical protein